MLVSLLQVILPQLLATAVLAPVVPEPMGKPLPAPTPVVELSWSAPAECPDDQAVLDRIVLLVGRPLAQDPTRTLHVTGRIEGGPARGYRLALELRLGEDEHASRELHARTCDTLLEPAAVIVAVAVDPHAEAPASAPETPLVPLPPLVDAPESLVRVPSPAPEAAVTDAEPKPAAEIIDDPRARPAAPPRPSKRLRAVLGLAGGLAIGTVPRVGGSLEATVGLLLPRVRLELDAIHLFRRRVPGPVADTFGELRITAARPVVCARFGRSRLEVPLCGGIELGLLRAQGVGVSAPAVRRYVWLAMLASTGLAFEVLPRLALRLHAGVALVLLRREFTLLGTRIATTGPVDGRFGLGFEVRLP